MHTSREGIRRLPRVDSQNNELITADPSHNIALPKRGCEHLRSSDDRQVARLMAVNIIKFFQTVEINKKQQAELIISTS
ncbi:hypothetical protein D3C86_1780360 [compost metagenome]